MVLCAVLAVVMLMGMVGGEVPCYTRGTWEPMVDWREVCGESGRGRPHEWFVYGCERDGYMDVGRMTGEQMMKVLRNEWLVFVGDEGSMRMYYATVCQLTPERYVEKWERNHEGVRYYPRYNATVSWVWTSHLVAYSGRVEEEDSGVRAGKERGTVVVLGTGKWWMEKAKEHFVGSMEKVFKSMSRYTGRTVFHLQPGRYGTRELRNWMRFSMVLLAGWYPDVEHLETGKMDEDRIDMDETGEELVTMPGVADAWVQLLFMYVLT